MNEADREWLEWQIETAPSDWVPHARAILAELDRRGRQLARLGNLPLEAAFTIDGEPDQLMFRRPDGSLVILTREARR